MKLLKIAFLLNMFLVFAVTSTFAQVEKTRIYDKDKTEKVAKKSDKETVKYDRKKQLESTQANRKAAQADRKVEIKDRNADRKVAQKEKVKGRKAAAKDRKVIQKERKKGMKKSELQKPNHKAKAKKSTIETGNNRF
ncbi:MAG: hypothetical protein AB8G22_15200 [Saprospiraceae bacterium]